MSQEQNIEGQEGFSYEETITNWNPIAGPVKDRGYTKPNISDAEIVADLEEPTFDAPSFSQYDEEEQGFQSDPEPERPMNPQFSELDNKDKKRGAKQMAEMVLDLYSKGCGLLGMIPQISESKIDSLIADGEIDPNASLPTPSGEVPIRDFAQEYNETVKEAFEVSSEFKEKVTPPLTRVFEKRGIGMTDEQQLIYYFAVDIGSKGVSAFMLKKQTNNILDALREQNIMLRDAQYRSERPATPPVSEPVVQQPIRDTAFEPSEPEEGEVIQMPVRKAKKPRTNLEEQVVESFGADDPVYSNLTDNGGFTQQAPQADNMPKFGDPTILAEMERISKQEPQKRGTRTMSSIRTGAKRGRKPKNK